MAWYFELEIECGEDELSAGLFVQQFDGVEVVFPDGLKAVLFAITHIDSEGHQCVSVGSKNIMCGGGNDPNLTKRQYTSEAGRQLYERLRGVSGSFRFALVGWEVDQAFTYNQLVVENWNDDGLPGLVVSKEIWLKFGCPSYFVPFKEGYYWHEYEGEKIDY